MFIRGNIRNNYITMITFSLLKDSLRDYLRKTVMSPTYIRAFGYELMIELTSYTGFNYLKESRTERELQLGKVRVMISGDGSSGSGLLIERFNHR